MGRCSRHFVTADYGWASGFRGAEGSRLYRDAFKPVRLNDWVKAFRSSTCIAMHALVQNRNIRR